ncbi:hypothetical protein DFH28DRAFT_914329, partial [Melampsora americana]
WDNLPNSFPTLFVNAQDVLRGAYPNGAYVSSNQVPINFFSECSEEKRTKQIKQGMLFLHSLISQKITSSLKLKDSKPDSKAGN